MSQHKNNFVHVDEKVVSCCFVSLAFYDALSEVLKTPSTMTPTPTAECKICLSDHFEQDEELLPVSKYDYYNMAQLVTPCNCAGSIAAIHMGCLLLDICTRGSRICSICSIEYRVIR